MELVPREEVQPIKELSGGETTNFTVLKGEMVMIQNSNIHICTCSWLEFSRNAATYVSQFYNIQK